MDATKKKLTVDIRRLFIFFLSHGATTFSNLGDISLVRTYLPPVKTGSSSACLSVHAGKACAHLFYIRVGSPWPGTDSEPQSRRRRRRRGGASVFSESESALCYALLGGSCLSKATLVVLVRVYLLRTFCSGLFVRGYL